MSICGIFFACRELVCTTVAKVSIGPGSVGVAGTSIGVTATPIMIIAASACPTRKNGSESNPRNSLSDSFGGVRAGLSGPDHIAAPKGTAPAEGTENC